MVDPNTNHAYYWNPATNEVSWTLPENGVINDEKLPSASKPSETSSASNGGSEASPDTTYADYYAYYAQTYFGVDATKEQKAQQSATAQTASKGKASDAAKSIKGNGTTTKTKEVGGAKTGSQGLEESPLPLSAVTVVEREGGGGSGVTAQKMPSVPGVRSAFTGVQMYMKGGLHSK